MVTTHFSFLFFLFLHWLFKTGRVEQELSFASSLNCFCPLAQGHSTVGVHFIHLMTKEVKYVWVLRNDDGIRRTRHIMAHAFYYA